MKSKVDMNSIQQLILDYKVREAFWASAEDVEHNEEHQRFFLSLLRQRNNVALLQEDAERISQLANNGNSFMQYAVARLHDCVPPSQDSNRIKRDCYISAYLNARISDARAFLALTYRDGDYGEADVELYRRLTKVAADEGSEKAIQQELRDAIYGQFGKEKAPEQAYDMLEQIISEAICNHEVPDPIYYSLMGDADIQLGRVSNALYNYETAARKGCSSAFFWQAFYSCCDENGNVEDREEFINIMDKAREVGASEAFLAYSMLMYDELYDKLADEDKTTIHQSLFDDLRYATMLGESIAPLYLGGYYEEGLYGFPKDYNEAWKWYSAGALLREPSCFSALIRMILDDKTAPKSYDEAYAYECAYKALMLRGDTLQTVIEGYRKGMLDHHTAAIEQIYLPQFEQKMEEDLKRMEEISGVDENDDEEEDDGRYDA
jgi:TPR repeat protein